MNKKELFEYLKMHPNGNVQENIFKKKYQEHYIKICNLNFPEDFTFQQKLFHYFNDDYDLNMGICPVCGNRCKYRRINEGYSVHCSTTCSSKDPIVKEKLKLTNLGKYGYTYSSKNIEVKEKKKKTNLEKYGYDNPSKSDVVKNKMILTNLEKYGKPNFSQTYLFTKHHKKRVFYDDKYFDSNWEVIVYKYCLMTNKNVIYNPDILFEYSYNNKKHYYQPDFLIDGIFYEVKGNQFFLNGKMVNPYDHSLDELYEAKHQCMIQNEVKLILEEDINKMKNKLELFEYLKNIEDKSGGFKKEDSIKKNYPEIYEELKKVSFPDNFTFIQKLWHFLQDDFTIHKCECGNELHFIDFKKGYRTYCSKTCPCVLEHNKKTISKAQLASRNEESRKKSVETKLKKNGGKYWSNENLEKISRPYKDNVERCEKLKKFYLDHKEERCLKIQETIKQNIDDYINLTGTKIKGSTSEIEIEFYKYLIYMFGKDNIIVQYYSSHYPYSCDFYIPTIDLYIEIQGNWTHGGHPYDENNSEDVSKLNLWKSKGNKYYDNAIYTWTDLDIRKRKCAEDSQLNYIEIFSHHIEECVNIFNEYFKSLLLKWCLKNDFPGTSKWSSDHPIWNCNVGNRKSPKEAWGDEKYLKKAIDNIFYVASYDVKVRTNLYDEILSCCIENNEIVYSSKKLLILILNRFTIAKIAPRVTAISPINVKRIIDESGIDISKGVYVPMSGFGGIPKGVEMWGDDHNIKIDCECYDINQNLCDWYGWTQKDMLSQKIKTDKVCICCPPFGKKYEHWDGTPREMSETEFETWYKLIKEYVDAPEYIIIGPEIDHTGLGSNKGVDSKGDKISGLFTKVSGVMVWTDDMIYSKEG